jgi:hypothetical protein
MAVFYCRCKQKERIWAEVWWQPDRDKHMWVFFDDDKDSETYGQSINNCPGCGEELHRKMLTAVRSRIGAQEQTYGAQRR